jgi:lysophospholipase L1-like esterase
MPILLFSVLLIPAAVVAAELLARRFLRWQNRYCVWEPYFRMEMHIDHKYLPRLNSIVRFNCNSQGVRGDDLPRGCDRLYRILVTGGSPAECGLSDQDDSWPMILQNLLSRPENLMRLGASHVHVGNIARSGLDAQALDLVLEHALEPLGELDLILVMVGGSNVLNWMKADTPPDPEYRRPDIHRFFAWQPNGPFHWKPRYTALAEILRRVRHCLTRPIEMRYGVGKSLNAARQMRANAAEMRDSTPDPGTFLRNYERALRSALRRARASGARVLVVRQPWFEKKHFTPEEEAQFWNCSVGDPFSGKCTIFYSHDVMFRLMHLIDVSTARVCADMGIEQIGIQHVVEPTIENYYDHLHFTPRGCAIVAQEVARAVLNRTHDPLPSTTAMSRSA